MLLLPVVYVVAILSNPTFGFETRIEWTKGSFYPISKLLDSGTEQDLFCSIETEEQTHRMLLLCPLTVGLCMTDCIENKDISCNRKTISGQIVFQYKFKVFKTFEGEWKCQYGGQSSRSLSLKVSDKPFIKSLAMTPKPAWKGKQLNITCQVMPMTGITGIFIQRILDDGTVENIANAIPYKVDQYSEGITIKAAEPDLHNKVQCIVHTESEISTAKILETNIYYFPSQLILTSSNPLKQYEIGSLISFQCSSDNGNPRPVVSLYKKRFGKKPQKQVSANVILTKYDNKAEFFCLMEKISGKSPNLTSNTIMILVHYPPEKIELNEEPVDNQLESQSKQFTCSSKGNSEPLSQIEWTLFDAYGRLVAHSETFKILERVKKANPGALNTLESTVKMTLIRKYNGFKIKCSIIYQGLNMLNQEKQIKVVFAPNHISLIPDPQGGIPETRSVNLTCFTGSSNPSSNIQWFRTEPGKRPEDITSHSNKDMMPSNYSGIAIHSSLNIHGTNRQDHGTIYKCIVSHAYMNSEISKEYFLNVLYPPVIQLFSLPKIPNEGNFVQLQCQTSGGNPSIISQSQFQWKFCPVITSYEYKYEDQPNTEIRQNCYQLPDMFSFHHHHIFNITAAAPKDRGWYSCQCENAGGVTVEFMFLNVYFSPILKHQTSSRVYVKSGSNIVLQVKWSSYPKIHEIKWFIKPNSRISARLYEPDHQAQNINEMKKRIDLSPNSRFKLTIVNSTIQLNISSITAYDYGDYFCEVSNSRGQSSIEFQIFPTNDISISESNIRLQFNANKATVYFDPPTIGHFTHMSLRVCLIQSSGTCSEMQINNPNSGHATISLPQSPSLYNYRLIVHNGSKVLQMTNIIQRDISSPHWVEMSLEMMIAVIIGVVGILVLLFVALMTLILLKCRRKKPKDNYLENNSVATTNSHQRRQDYMLLNSPQNNSLLKNGCHCFSNYPLEMRSDNGSDHSVPSQNIYQTMMIRRKIRDNGEMSSVHSGGSCHSPDVVLTERTSINSASNPMVNGNPYPYSISNGPTKVNLLSGRLHSVDGLRQDPNMPEEYHMPQEMMFAAVDDGMNLSQTRIIPIPKHLSSEYPIFFQMNNAMIPKSYEMTMPSHYTSPMPQLECNNQNSRESSSLTNSNSNQDSGTHEISNVENRKDNIENIQSDS
uniref:NPHS1-7 n=1 Tax=Schmidtea mediterranea TaxID=79327 RepID=A0A0H3YKM4_SCHMD|nr:NPHS1-7 [Schmidtea mediterranea]